MKFIGVDVGVRNSIVTSSGYMGESVDGLEEADANKIYEKEACWLVAMCASKGLTLVVEDLKRAFSCKFISFFFHCEYEASRLGVKIIRVSPNGTSNTCSKCGYKNNKNRKDKQFKCLDCGFEIDADLNASLNIKAIGEHGKLMTRKYTVSEQKEIDRSKNNKWWRDINV